MLHGTTKDNLAVIPRNDIGNSTRAHSTALCIPLHRKLLRLGPQRLGNLHNHNLTTRREHLVIVHAGEVAASESGTVYDNVGFAGSRRRRVRDLSERLQGGDGEAVDGSSTGENLFLEVFQVLWCVY